MSERTELFEATLDGIPEGIALLDQKRLVRFWNRTAEAITGYSSIDLLGRPVSEVLALLLQGNVESENDAPENGLGRGYLAHSQHKLGHELLLMAQIMLLRDGLGGRIGTAIIFHPAESLDALPRGETCESGSMEVSQTELKDRLEMEFGDFSHGGLPFGVLWILVDQAQVLRKTHGAGACTAMLEKVERVLIRGLRPTELMGRWGDNEFLVISHERSPEMLATHAQVLAGLTRTTDFRWWGDRVSLTVSIGAAQAELSGSLVNLLERAKAAMLTSFDAGGNQITSALGGQACSPS